MSRSSHEPHVNANGGTSTGHSVWKPEVATEICSASNYARRLGADYCICSSEDGTGGVDPNATDINHWEDQDEGGWTILKWFLER
jgi:hypothetical protein